VEYREVCSSHSAEQQVRGFSRFALFLALLALSLAAAVQPATAATTTGVPFEWGCRINPCTNQGTPLPVGLNGVVSLAAGRYHSLAATVDGSVWAWGYNGCSQLGNESPVNGVRVSHDEPLPVDGVSDATAVSAGGAHSLALNADGTVSAWGGNYSGELGDGTQQQRATPVQVTGLTDVIAIAAGGRDCGFGPVYFFSDGHSLALKRDGTLWAWGSNYLGALGDGGYYSRTTPVQVTALSDVVAIDAYLYESLALKRDGTVWAWGWNAYGQLGDGTTTDRSTPVQVSGLSDVVAISSGGTHSLAVKSDGTVWAWGYNAFGELGDGTRDNRLTPVQVSDLSDVVTVGAGSWHSLAATADGSVWAWGDNFWGQLGTGGTDDTGHPTPAQVLGLTRVVSVDGGYSQSLALVGEIEVGRIVVKKDAVPDDPQNFSFTASGGLLPPTFKLDDDSDPTLSNTQTFENVPVGSGYAVAEDAPLDPWVLTSASCDDGSPPSNISVSVNETVTCSFTNTLPFADLALTSSVSPDPVSVGGLLTYTITVANEGGITDTSTRLTDELPRSVRFRSARSDRGRCVQRTRRRVECNLAELAGGEQATVTIVVRPTRAGTITNAASVTGNQPDHDLTNNDSTQTTSVQP
jgi:uncharacterized repeat protein (TIGR01451 family)